MPASPAWEFHAYAIVCHNDYIADADGGTPEALRNHADWAYFQSQLSGAVAIILGRHSHFANPNPHNRLRVVMSRQSAGLERKPDGWWWNPERVTLRHLLSTIAPDGGRIAIPGGQGAFDYFLAHGLTAFHLSRASEVALDGGQKLLGACCTEKRAEEVLRAAGLQPEPRVWLDPTEKVSLAVWRRVDPDLV